jgi:superfamily II DNA or RNA helicase
MECSPEYRKVLSDELTYKVPPQNPNDPPQIIKNLQRVRENLVSIPIGRIDLIPKDYEIVEKRLYIPADFPKFSFQLRPSQQEVYDTLDDNAIINAWVSWGKTFTGLALAGKLGQKTLVVTHTVPLRNQWAKEVEKVYGFTPGIIGSGRFDTSSPVVIGNTQTLYRNIDKIRKEFGTIILDEMHHVSSPTFGKIIDTSHARYKIGLSGTIERKDGKHVVFRDYFSPNVYKPPKENFLTPSIHIYRSEVRFPDGSNIPWVLVVSDRVHFLKSCAELTGEKSICVTGEVAHENREKLVDEILYGDKEILYGTQAIFSEGISVNTLSCLILATPINNEPLLTQLIGRVVRKHDNKRDPVIIDIHLKGKTAQRQASNRMGYYMKQGYQIKQL